MVHNLLKSNHEAMNPLHTEFADDNDISDYAKPAVSSLSSMGVINVIICLRQRITQHAHRLP